MTPARVSSTARPTGRIPCGAPKPHGIHRKTDTLHVVELLLDHTKVDSTFRYLGVEPEDAFSIAKKIDICMRG